MVDKKVTLYSKILSFLRRVFNCSSTLKIESECKCHNGTKSSAGKSESKEKKVFPKKPTLSEMYKKSTQRVFKVDGTGRKVEIVSCDTKCVSYKNALKEQCEGLRLLTYKEASYIMSTCSGKRLGFFSDFNRDQNLFSLRDSDGGILHLPFCWIWCSDKTKGKYAYTVNLAFSSRRKRISLDEPHTLKNQKRGCVLLVKDI